MRKKSAKAKTRPWDAAEHMTTEEDMATCLEAALEDGDPALIVAALGDIARAKGMSQIARETGLGNESLYKARSPDGNPEFSTVLKAVRALGLRLRAAAEVERGIVFIMDQADDVGRRRTLGVANRGKEGRDCLSKAEDESSFATYPGLTLAP